MSTNLIYSLANSVATITLNRPEKRNALDIALLIALSDALDRVVTDGTRALLLNAQGPGFCSGGDLSSGGDGADDLGEIHLNYYEPVARKLSALTVPVVSAVQGAAAGAGCSLALAADLVIADTTAYFLLSFANIGLVPDMGASWLVAKAVGRARAMEMALLGERVSAEQALAWGMINRVVEPEALQAESMALATRLANGPTLALGMIRQAINAAYDVNFAESLATESHNQATAGRSNDVKEAVSAFIEKRKPVFTGR